MPGRRLDPDRKDRIIDAALEVIADLGVAHTTHRAIAARAEVPLGSVTYYFAGLGDVLTQAFGRHAERMSQRFAEHFGVVRDVEQLVDAVTDFVYGDTLVTARDWVIAYELYLAALRDPALREVTDAWMRASRSVLERIVDPETARGVDALIEGFAMHRTLSTTPLPRAQVQEIVRRTVAPG